MAKIERKVEATGTDVEAAIAAGLEELGIDRDAVEVQVLDEGSRGVFGLGAREASVRLTIKPQPVPPTPGEPPAAEPGVVKAKIEPGPEVEIEPTVPERSEAEIARGALRELLTFMSVEDVKIDVRRAEAAPGEEEAPLMLDVSGPDTDVLIGHRGDTLAALQRITRLIVGQETTSRVNLVLDVDGYKARREQSLRGLAKRLAEQAVRTNHRVVLEPMPPHERRIVHLTLRDHPNVTTESIGERDRRKVTIIPKRQ